jgi:hypothetical protein
MQAIPSIQPNSIHSATGHESCESLSNPAGPKPIIYYTIVMIVTSTTPFTPEQIAQIKERFGVYETVIDIQKKFAVLVWIGMLRRKILLESGSHQSDIWGGGIDLETKEIDYNSFINIRPQDNNMKNEIQSESIKITFSNITTYFFKSVL